MIHVTCSKVFNKFRAREHGRTGAREHGSTGGNRRLGNSSIRPPTPEERGYLGKKNTTLFLFIFDGDFYKRITNHRIKITQSMIQLSSVQNIHQSTNHRIKIAQSMIHRIPDDKIRRISAHRSAEPALQ